MEGRAVGGSIFFFMGSKYLFSNVNGCRVMFAGLRE